MIRSVIKHRYIVGAIAQQGDHNCDRDRKKYIVYMMIPSLSVRFVHFRSAPEKMNGTNKRETYMVNHHSSSNKACCEYRSDDGDHLPVACMIIRKSLEFGIQVQSHKHADGEGGHGMTTRESLHTKFDILAGGRAYVFDFDELHRPLIVETSIIWSAEIDEIRSKFA